MDLFYFLILLKFFVEIISTSFAQVATQQSMFSTNNQIPNWVQTTVIMKTH